jgi:DNA-3-methyladenine glycosylase II
MTTFIITPDVAFSLDAAASFGFGPNAGRPKPDGGQMRLAFVTDDLAHQVGVHLTQPADGAVAGAVHAAVTGDEDLDIDAVQRQVARILSLDHPGADWLAVGQRDPVVGALQAALPGLRPVLFHSPYEAAAWSIISTRRHHTQAAAIRTRLAQAEGRVFEVGGETAAAFPTPAQLLTVDGFPGLDPVRIDRLHAIARAALDGLLDPARLAALDAEQALEEVQQLPGIGPTYGTLIVMRATGVTDMMTYNEPRLPTYAARFYGTGPNPMSRADLEAVTDKWRPYRTWTAVLMRVAGDRGVTIA